jgi:hypothetical protein
MMTKEVAAPRRREATVKANRTKLRNALEEQMLNAARDRDWIAVNVICAAIYILAERGEI